MDIQEGHSWRGQSELPTLICGGTGCGKTLLAMEFLVRGATQFGEPGVFISVEEKSDELTKLLVINCRF